MPSKSELLNEVLFQEPSELPEVFVFPNLLKVLFLNFSLWPDLVILMPLEMIVCTVPHFKALNSIFDHSIQNGHGSPFT